MINDNSHGSVLVMFPDLRNGIVEDAITQCRQCNQEMIFKTRIGG